jgi:RAT1-interacting protein
MATFSIEPLEQFVGKSAAIKRPTEIYCYSIDEERQYHADDSSLSWYYPARPGADLNTGYETFRKRDDSQDGHLDTLLRALMELEQKDGKKCEVDFITWRGMMTKVHTLQL